LSNTNIDIRDSTTGISNLSAFTITRSKGTYGAEAKFVIEGIDQTYSLNSSISFRNLNLRVVSKDYVVSNGAMGGWQTIITAQEDIAQLSKQAPKKAMHFMSMTEDEKAEFDFACNYNYSSLDYIPYIKICDPQTGRGGWRSGDIISILASKCSFTVQCNCYSYWVKQVIASPSQSYLSTILSLVSMFNPIIYSQGGVIFILDKPRSSGGDIDLSKIEMVTHREVINRDAEVTQIKVQGGQGIWRHNKFKGYIQDIRDATLTTTNTSQSNVINICKFEGTREIVKHEAGKKPKTTTEKVEITVRSLFPEKMNIIDTIEEKWKIDMFGNPWYLVSRKTTRYNTLVDAVVLDQEESFEYEFTAEKFQTPRKRRSITTVNKYSWLVVKSQGVTRRFYKSDTDRIVEEFVYGENGRLLQKIKQRYSDVVKYTSGGKTYYMELSMADRFFNDSGENWYDLMVEKMVVEETITTYKEITPNMYEETVITRYLGGGLRPAGDGTFVKSHTREIYGRPPRAPKRYRKMPVYAEEGTGSGTLSSPAYVVSSGNIIDWEDAENILTKVKKSRIKEKKIVTRSYTIPYELWLDLFWPASFGEVAIAGGDSIPESTTATDGQVVSIEIDYNINRGVNTNFIVEAKTS